VAVRAAQAARADQVVDEGVRPVPLPGEPAAQFGFGGEDGGPDGGDDQVGQRRAGVPGRRPGTAGVNLVPASQFARVRVALSGGDLGRPGDDHAAALERRAQRLELLPLERQFGAQVLDVRRARRRQMVEQAAPAGVGGAHPVKFGAADGVEQIRGFGGDQQVLAPVHRDADVTALDDLAEPRPLGGGPGGEPAAARLVRLLVARLVEAGQRGVRGPRQQAPPAQERVGLVERLKRPVRRQPALECPARPQVGQ
jgi:hypothetical protein